MDPVIETPPTKTETPPAPDATTKTVAEDPWQARILADLGIVVKDGKVEDAPPIAPAPATAQETSDREVATFTTMGEHARYKAEKKAAEESKINPDVTKPGEAPPDEKKDDKTAETPPAKTEADKPKSEGTPPAKKAPIKVEKERPLEEIVEGVVRRMQPQPPAEATKPEPKKADDTKDPNDEFIQGLDDDQKEAVQLAQYAAKTDPAKYGTLPNKLVAYIKKADEMIEKKLAENPEWDSAADEQFSAWVAENNPALSHSETRKLERQMIAEEAEARVVAKFRPRMEQAERVTRAQELKPEVDKASDSFRQYVVERMSTDDKSPFHSVVTTVAKAGINEEGWKQADQVDPLASEIARNYTERAVSLGREYLELASGLKQEDPNSQQQRTLFGFIDQQEAIFSRDGGDMKVVGGKTFVTRREFAALPEAERSKHWVLGHQDVLDMLAVAAREQAKTALTTEVTRLERAGYVRSPKKDAANKEEKPAKAATKSAESPKATTSVGPGAANGAAPPNPLTLITEDDLKRQWSGGAASMRA